VVLKSQTTKEEIKMCASCAPAEKEFAEVLVALPNAENAQSTMPSFCGKGFISLQTATDIALKQAIKLFYLHRSCSDRNS
jgi:hypothetical protein